MTSSSADAEVFLRALLLRVRIKLPLLIMTAVQLRYIKAQAKRAARKEKELQRDELYIRRICADIY